jgi:hypothetical protein
MARLYFIDERRHYLYRPLERSGHIEKRALCLRGIAA